MNVPVSYLSKRTLSAATLSLSVMFYILSLCFSCFYIEGKQPDYRFMTADGPGFVLLLMGWLGVIAGEVAWIANPLWMAGVVFLTLARKKSAKSTETIASGIIALFLAIGAQIFTLTFLLQSKTLCGSGASIAQIAGYCPGYYLWNLSMFTLIVTAWLTIVSAKKLTQIETVNA